jgi:hypothetical protein
MSHQKEVGLYVNIGKKDYTLMSRSKDAGQNHNITTVTRSYGNVAEFKHLAITATNENLIQKKIERRAESGNVCCHSVQNLLSSCLMHKNINIKMYKPVTSPVLLYGCETWSLPLR